MPDSDGPIILLSNDDGVRSEGIAALAEAMKALGTVYIVAPDRERSAASHSLTLSHPLRVEKLGPRVWSVDGTPTYCLRQHPWPAVCAFINPVCAAHTMLPELCYISGDPGCVHLALLQAGMDPVGSPSALRGWGE